MDGCSLVDAHIVKRDKYSISLVAKNDLEREAIKQILYISAAGSLIYA